VFCTAALNPRLPYRGPNPGPVASRFGHRRLSPNRRDSATHRTTPPLSSSPASVSTDMPARRACWPAAAAAADSEAKRPDRPRATALPARRAQAGLGEPRAGSRLSLTMSHGLGLQVPSHAGSDRDSEGRRPPGRPRARRPGAARPARPGAAARHWQQPDLRPALLGLPVSAQRPGAAATHRAASHGGQCRPARQCSDSELECPGPGPDGPGAWQAVRPGSD
jgi:hypothetical protein